MVVGGKIARAKEGEDGTDGRTYATVSARERGEGKCVGESRYHSPFDILAR